MSLALRPRPLAICLLVAAALMVFAGAGRAAAAQRAARVHPDRQPIAYSARLPHVGHRRRSPVAYADGRLSLRQYHRR